MERGGQDYYIQTRIKPEQRRWPPAGAGAGAGGGAGGNLPSLPRPLLSGLVWHQTSGLFSRWKEVFLILTKDCLRSGFLLRPKASFPPLQVPQDCGLSQDSSIWGSVVEPRPGPHVRREVRGAEGIPHSLSGGSGNHQDLPQED